MKLSWSDAPLKLGMCTELGSETGTAPLLYTLCRITLMSDSVTCCQYSIRKFPEILSIWNWTPFPRGSRWSWVRVLRERTDFITGFPPSFELNHVGLFRHIRGGQAALGREFTASFRITLSWKRYFHQNGFGHDWHVESTCSISRRSCGITDFQGYPSQRNQSPKWALLRMSKSTGIRIFSAGGS